ncbi:hypothetical protein Celal_0366 [Cellulophaga algicola DSM 14237]|uniref:Uncharacterized protein n=1 Tax=Cellulophaga algicola (strain DSM 14237 / IC166 / ACAM 630) TaxID=688270 RepID=E6XA20_CELAD|nr:MULTISPECIES: hypothetical protein [Cellulophaga]ADV47710.1 hypothetical protein Celal_0366 [Cellulophaga algicola DSM 14237]
MKSKYTLLYVVLIIACSSFATNRDCEYVGSNIEYITSQTKKALTETDLNKTKYQIYKAINAIEKTRVKLNDCGCSYASKNLFEGLDNLILATKTSSIAGARVLINKALEKTALSLESLKEHHTHQSKYQADVLTLNTKNSEKEKLDSKEARDRELRQAIDSSLVKFEKSLEDVITTVDCEEAKNFIIEIKNKCDQALLNDELSEGKKYFNLRTKVIATNALTKISNCH